MIPEICGYCEYWQSGEDEPSDGFCIMTHEAKAPEESCQMWEMGDGIESRPDAMEEK